MSDDELETTLSESDDHFDDEIMFEHRRDDAIVIYFKLMDYINQQCLPFLNCNSALANFIDLLT